MFHLKTKCIIFYSFEKYEIAFYIGKTIAELMKLLIISFIFAVGVNIPQCCLL